MHKTKQIKKKISDYNVMQHTLHATNYIIRIAFVRF